MRMRLCLICNKASFCFDDAASHSCPHCGYSFDAGNGFERIEGLRGSTRNGTSEIWDAAIASIAPSRMAARLR